MIVSNAARRGARPVRSRRGGGFWLPLLLAPLVAVGANLANGLFTDTATTTGNTISTSTVDISVAPTSAVVSYSGMMPGDVVTAPLTVTNAGTAQLRYAVSSTTTENVLAAELDLQIKVGVTTCTNGGFAADGTSLYGPADLGSTTGINVMGNPTAGSQAGDRTLNAAANEILCIRVSLPSGSTLNSAITTTATLTFAAEQTANN